MPGRGAARQPFIAMRTDSHGYRFVYDGGDTIHVRSLQMTLSMVDEVMSIPDWVILPSIDYEAFRVLCLLWLYRQGEVAV